VSQSIACAPVAIAKRELRAQLQTQRLATHAQDHARTALEARLADLLATRAPHIVGFYWPLPGEFDARAVIAHWLAADTTRRAALPVIEAADAPLRFHAWTPGAAMRTGAHRIPEPDNDEAIVPELLLIPCVGFDADGFRLGYGGGYYDRTLAHWPAASPFTIGLAYEACRVAHLPRETHDRPLDCIVTELALHGRTT
jgi:5-formyltetrahydrofolate cyclo-ligase